MFLAYGSKLTNLFFVPGLLVASWLMRRRLRDPMLFLVCLMGWVALEWAFYAFIVGEPLGRLGAIRRHVGAALTAGYTWLGLWERYSISRLGAEVDFASGNAFV